MTEPSVPVPSAPRSFGQRLVGALMLDASVYEEVEHDASAMGQAAGVVGLGAAASAIALAGSAGLGGVFGAILQAFVGWVVASAVILLVGVKMMGHTSDYPELLRTIGFASAPQILTIAGIIPLIGWIAVLAAIVLGLIAYVIAVRQALDVATGRAVLVCILAVIAQALIGVFLQLIGLGSLYAGRAVA